MHHSRPLLLIFEGPEQGFFLCVCVGGGGGGGGGDARLKKLSKCESGKTLWIVMGIGWKFIFDHLLSARDC